MAIFYPSVACNLTLRFDEALLNGNTPTPATPNQGAQAQVGGPGGPLEKAELLSGTADRLSQVLAIVPKNASIELPTPRQAPKFTITCAFRDFPIDPRAIRAIGVELYLGVVSSDDFARGMAGIVDNGRLASQIVLEPRNLLLAGTVDSISAEHTSSSSEVRMEGKGLQGLFLTAKATAAQLKALNINKPIDQVVAQLLPMDAQGKKIPVRVQAEDWPDGLPSPAAPELLTRINQGADGQQANMPMKGDPNGANGFNVWDVITNLCNLVGAVPYFIGHELWVRSARGIFTQKNAGITGTTPFAGGKPRTIRTGSGSIDVSYRKMVYGKNLSRLNLERKFGATTTPVIRVVSIDTSANVKGPDRLIEVEYPDQDTSTPAAAAAAAKAKQITKARTTSVSPSGKSSRTEILSISVPGIKDKTRLRNIAIQLREEIARGEMGGSASTKDLASLGGDNDDADLIRLRPGDAIEFYTDASGTSSVPAVVSELNSQAALSVQEAVTALTQRFGGRSDLAQLLVGTARNQFVGLQNVFRVNNVKYSWDVGSGIGVDFDFHNYVTVRNDISGEDKTQGVVADVTSSPVQNRGFSSSGAA